MNGAWSRLNGFSGLTGSKERGKSTLGSGQVESKGYCDPSRERSASRCASCALECAETGLIDGPSKMPPRAIVVCERRRVRSTGAAREGRVAKWLCGAGEKSRSAWAERGRACGCALVGVKSYSAWAERGRAWG